MENTIQIRIPELRGDHAAMFLEQAEAATEIADQKGYARAAECLKTGKELEKEIRAIFDPVCESANAAHKRATAARRAMLQPLERVGVKLRHAMSRYVERMRIEEMNREAKERAAAKERAEADALARAADIEAQAEAARASGDVVKADALAADAEREIVNVTPDPVVPARVNVAPRVSGVALRKVWKWEIVDRAAIPRDYMIPDEKQIARVVNVRHGGHGIPGIRVWSEDAPVLRG